MHTVAHGIWRENLKTWKMRHNHCMTWNMVRNTEKQKKCDMHTVGPGIWRETLKKLKNEKCIL
jgi:hypothetical protein